MKCEKWTCVFSLFVCSLAMMLASCSSSDDNPASASTTDPLPFPMDAYKDSSVHPGDDFFQYSNGTWLKNTPIPESGAIGGVLYGSDIAMAQRVETLIHEEPYLKSFFAMMDKMYDTPDASMSYIQAQIEAVSKPATQDEAFEQVGRLYLEGIDCLMETHFHVDGGVLKIIMIPIDFSSMISSGKTQDQAAGQKILARIIKGMGITKESVLDYDEAANMFGLLKDMTPDDIYAAMQKAWQDQSIYASEEMLAKYNAEKNKNVTLQDVKDKARLSLNYPMSYYIAKKYVPDDKKHGYQEMGFAVKEAFRKRLQKVDWISESTRRNAIDKLDAMELYLGSPDTWYTEYIPKISDCATFIEMIHGLSKSKRQLQASLLGGTDYFTSMLLESARGSDGRLVPTDLSWANGKYRADCNAVFYYPSLLMPPGLVEDVSMARQYAFMSSIAHEITHGFDSDGAKYDKNGKENNWWTAADQAAFKERQQKIIDSYSSLEAEPELLPGVLCDGEKTLAEDIADLGGFLAARDAYMEYLEQNGYTGETYQEQLRKYYEGFADVWRVRYSQKKAEDLQRIDFHAMAHCRVNGVVMNTDMFYDLYDVDETRRLYLAPEKRAYIW